jgi:hypothetical protein
LRGKDEHLSVQWALPPANETGEGTGIADGTPVYFLAAGVPRRLRETAPDPSALRFLVRSSTRVPSFCVRVA